MIRLGSLLSGLAFIGTALAQPADPADAKKSEPLLLLDGGGPTSPVTAVAFAPDGNTVYAVGLDKLIRSWTLDPRTRQFRRTDATLRVPIGPGLEGSLNALAVSADGRYLAVGGKSLARGTAGFRVDGRMTPPIGGMTPEMRLDQGTIFLFDRQQNTVKTLRSHTGAVLNLAFLPSGAAKPPMLVSAAQEWDTKTDKFVGGLRLWDVTKDEPLASTVIASAPTDRRPAIAAMRTGDGPTQVSAAFAWEDGKLRIWEAATNEVRELADGVLNNAAAITADGRLFTTAMTRDGGRLHEWAIRPEITELAGDRQTFFKPDGKHYVYPRGLTLCSSAPNKPADMAAVLLRTPTQGERYELALVPFSGDMAFRPAVRIKLWDGGQMPTVETVSGGKFLAVSGAPDQGVRVFPIADLLAGKQVEPQVLRSDGTNFRYVAWVTDGKQTGIVLAPKSGPATADRKPPADLEESGLVFDPTARKLIPFAKPWTLTAPEAAGWSAKASDPDAEKRIAVTVTQNGAARGVVKLPATAIPTDLAVLLPIAPRTVPILALGYLDESRQPILALYNGATGEKLRQLTAHQAPTRHLAFSPDGKLLASVASDQTACIWSLTDLDQAIGQRGRIDGLGVKTVNGKPEVARVDSESPVAKLLKEGDRIDGVVRDGKLVPLKGALSFYHAVDGVKPGQNITLRVIGGNDVAVPVGQGVDERKPLLSLFVFQEADGRRDWIAWNPNGPYDTGTLKAERHFGWHINPVEPGGPVVHAGAEQYRGDFRKEGIARHLIRRGNLADALQDWDGPKVPKPNMGLGIDELGPAAPKREGRILVRRPDLHFRAGVGNPTFPADRIGSMEWRLDDGPWRAFTDSEDAGRSRTADLSVAPWSRGKHELAVRLRSTGNRPEEFLDSLPVYYLPAEPVVSLPPAWKKAVFGDGPVKLVIVKDKPRFRLEADVQPGVPKEKVRVTLAVNGVAKPVGTEIRQEIELQEGPNRIVLTAENVSAAKDEPEERTVQAFEVTYAPDAPPPLIAIAPLEGSDSAPQPGQTVRVTAPTLPLSAFITAESPLTELTFQGKPVDGFKSGDRQYLLDLRVPLKPGKQDLTIAAKTKAGSSTKSVLSFEYVPRLPVLVFTGPGEVADLAAGRDAALQTFKFRIVPATDAHPFTIAANHNGQPLEPAKAMAADAKEWSVPVRLTGGRNRVEVKLTNEWGAQATTIAEATYRRPPKVAAIEKPTMGAKPKFDLVAAFTTPTDLPLTRVLLNNRELPTESFAQEKAADGVATWKLIAKDVPLERGPNSFTLIPLNSDGPALEEGTLDVNFVPPVPPKAVIDLLDPGRDLTVEVDNYAVHFRVRSASPLEKVTIVRNDGQSVPINVANAVAAAGGGFELDVTQPLSLSSGANPLQIEAINAGGLAAAPLTITFLSPPVEILVDRLTDDKGTEYRPKLTKDGTIEVPAIPTSHVTLHGRVRWSEGVPGPKGESRVRIWVNGFQQFPAELDPPAEPNSRERRFSANLILNRQQANRIDIHLPDLPVRDRAHRHFHVRSCDKPLTQQRLHLLVVGLGSQDPEAVKARAIAAVEAKPNPDRPGTLVSPRFSEVRVYGPLVGYVNRGVVNTQLRLIQHAIRVRRTQTSAKPIDEVVMVYYQGAEHYDDGGYFLMTDESQEYRTVRRQREVGIGENDLAAFFAQTFGAQVLLLDVARTAPVPAEPPGLLGESRGLGLLRTAWRGEVGTVSGDDRLLALMARVGPTAATIRHLADNLGESIDQMASRYPPESLRYEAFVPVSLEWLPLSAPLPPP